MSMGHKLQMYENLRDMLEREVSAIEHKNDIDESSLDHLYKLTTSLKTVDKCIDREKEEEYGKEQSMRGNSFIGNRYVYARDGQSYDGMSNDMSNDGMSNHWPMMRPMYYRDGGRSYDGMSNMGDMSRDGGNSYNSYGYARDGRAGRDADSDGQYSEEGAGNSNRGRRNSYNSYDGNSYEYSRDESRKKMVQKLETLMDDTMSENERKAIMECISKIK
jgi:hypothetical protein